MKFLRTIICLCCLLCSGLQPGLALAQQRYSNLKFHHLSSDNNLPSGSIYSIAQDTDGNVWFGNEYGASCFDGYNVTNHFFPEPVLVVDYKGHYKAGLFTDNDGGLWAAFGHLYHFDKSSETFRKMEWFCYSDVYDFIDIGGGVGLIATEGGIKSIDVKSGDAVQTPHALTSLAPLKFRRKGDFLFILTMSNDVLEYNLKTRHVFPVFHFDTQSTVNDFLVDESIWIATNGDGLLKYETGTGRLEHYKYNGNPSGSVCSNYVRSLALDGLGNVWMATADGLSIMDVSSGTFTTILCDQRLSNGISHGSLCRVFRDKDGLMWLGAALRGVDYCYPEERAFKTIDLGDFPECIVSSMSEDYDGTIWVGTTRMGAFHYFPSSGEVRRILVSDKEPVANDIGTFFMHSGGKYVYIGTVRRGLFRYDRRTSEIYHCGSDTSPEAAHSILPNEDGTKLWISSADGIYLYDIEKDSFRRAKGDTLFQTHPMGLHRDSQDMVWCFTYDSGLFCFRLAEDIDGHPVVYDCTHIGTPAGILSFKESEGRVWITTIQGIYSYGGNVWRHEFYGNGMSSNCVRSIEFDSKGGIWVGTDFGLNRIDPSTKSVSAYFIENGLPANEFRARASLYASDGTMYFGTIGGLSQFVPSDFSLSSHSNAPRVGFAVVGGERKVFNGESPLSVNPDDGTVSLFFSVPNYLSYKKDRFYYRLLPLARDWSLAPSNSVTYSSLKHGKYTFELYSENSNGDKSESVFSMPIIVLPRWYERTVSRIVSFLIIIALLVLLAMRLKKYAKAKLDEKAMRMVKDKERDLSSNKVRFYSNRLLSQDESAFLEKAISVAESHISDPSFKIDDYAYEMCMSRSNLHRHLVSTTGLSTSHFLNKIRLEKAIQMLGSGSYSVSQVGDMVGFSSTSYFVKLYKQYTGDTPGHRGIKH